MTEESDSDYLEGSEKEEEEELEFDEDEEQSETPVNRRADGKPQPWETFGKDAQIIARCVLQRKANPNQFKTIRKAVPQVDRWVKAKKYGDRTLDNVRRNTRKLIKLIHIYLINGNGK